MHLFFSAQLLYALIEDSGFASDRIIGDAPLLEPRTRREKRATLADCQFARIHGNKKFLSPDSFKKGVAKGMYASHFINIIEVLFVQ